MPYGMSVWNANGLNILGEESQLINMSLPARHFYGPNADTSVYIDAGWPIPGKNNALIIGNGGDPTVPSLINIVPYTYNGYLLWGANIFLPASSFATFFTVRLVSY